MLIKAIPIDVEHTWRNFSLQLMDLQQYCFWFILYVLAWVKNQILVLSNNS